ncbi:MAG: hypothetical protein OXS29_11455 [bacterium]|nr:hypothetical protein [bacterium]MDE0438526.1 hypothetical protein [bacterium]
MEVAATTGATADLRTACDRLSDISDVVADSPAIPLSDQVSVVTAVLDLLLALECWPKP